MIHVPRCLRSMSIFNMSMQRACEAYDIANQQMLTNNRNATIMLHHLWSPFPLCYSVTSSPTQLAFPLALSNFGWWFEYVWQVWDGLSMYGYVRMVVAQFEGSRATICPPANLHQFPPLHRRVALFDLWAFGTIRAWKKMKQPTAVRDRGRCWQKLMETDEI